MAKEPIRELVLALETFWKASRGQPSAIAKLEGIQKIKVLISEESV